jgi:putative membrane protein
MFSYHSLAALNSVLNGIAAILLLAGFYSIRRKRVRAHRRFMLSAFAVSLVFFVSYVIYHYLVGDVRFEGRGWVRPVYFSILASHISLAAVIVPLVLITLWRALSGNFGRHRRIAIWTWPIWIYVSITGVVVYLMCYQLYAPGYSMLRRGAVLNAGGRPADIIDKTSRAVSSSGNP